MKKRNKSVTTNTFAATYLKSTLGVFFCAFLRLILWYLQFYSYDVVFKLYQPFRTGNATVHSGPNQSNDCRTNNPIQFGIQGLSIYLKTNISSHIYPPPLSAFGMQNDALKEIMHVVEQDYTL
uniref:Uncharacterized protein n=1 Tax=Glossina pallidipes TaxID=7398 RepID=A0A1A9ZTQ0_GLOPL